MYLTSRIGCQAGNHPIFSKVFADKHRKIFFIPLLLLFYNISIKMIVAQSAMFSAINNVELAHHVELAHFLCFHSVTVAHY